MKASMTIFDYISEPPTYPSYNVTFYNDHYGRLVFMEGKYRFYPDSRIAPDEGFSADALKELANKVNELNSKVCGGACNSGILSGDKL